MADNAPAAVIAAFFLAVGLISLIWPDKVRDYSLMWSDRSYNPFLRWMKKPSYILCLRITGVVAIGGGLIALSIAVTPVR